MANKYLKKLRLTIGRWAANSLSQDIAIDNLAQLSRRLGISSVVASGDAGRFEGHPSDLVFQYYVRRKVPITDPSPSQDPLTRPHPP